MSDYTEEDYVSMEIIDLEDLDYLCANPKCNNPVEHNEYYCTQCERNIDWGKVEEDKRARIAELNEY